jgi:myo-inositol-1(or 4)-monophosphatase
VIEIVKEGLALAHALLDKLGRAARQEVADERTVDISTAGDRAVSELLTHYFIQTGIPSVVLSEESGEVHLSDRPEYTVVFDDIDGTDNYYRSEGILPYCTVIAILEGIAPAFSDTIAAGIVEHRSGTLWLAQRGGGTTVNGVPAHASGRPVLDRRTLIAVDHYASESDMPRLGALHRTAWVKDFGSAGMHMAGVASGIFDGYVTTRQKGHEIAAGHLLILEAGGCVTDFSGKPFKDRVYDFSAVYETTACGNEDLADSLRKLLHAPR